MPSCKDGRILGNKSTTESDVRGGGVFITSSRVKGHTRVFYSRSIHTGSEEVRRERKEEGGGAAVHVQTGRSGTREAEKGVQRSHLSVSGGIFRKGEGG